MIDAVVRSLAVREFQQAMGKCDVATCGAAPAFRIVVEVEATNAKGGGYWLAYLMRGQDRGTGPMPLAVCGGCVEAAAATFGTDENFADVIKVLRGTGRTIPTGARCRVVIESQPSSN